MKIKMFGDTGSSNVEFDAYIFDAQNSNTKTIESDIKNETLDLKLALNVKNSGYLKDAKILLGDGKTLNFKFDSDAISQNENVEAFENNELAITQLNAGSEVNVEIPISYENQKYIDIANVSKTNVIKFVGTYVNDEEEISVSKNVDLKLSWKDEREVRVSSDITKYIGYTSNNQPGIILQTLIKADNLTENNSLPVDNTEIKIEVPVISEVKPSSVNVVAKSLTGTNGKQNDEVKFGSDNFSYDKESNELTIKVKNTPELVSTQNENDILVDETIPQEERYYSGSGIDEYLVTYIYDNVQMIDREITSNVNVAFNMYGGNKLEANEVFVNKLSNQIGDIVTFNTDTTTKSISKGYTYLNCNNDDENKYEVQIDNKLIFNVSYKDIVEKLYYTDNKNTYTTKEGNTIEQDDIYYKKLTISKENFVNILGEDGLVNISNSNGELIFTINKDTQTTEDGNYEINFEKSVKGIQIEASKPINDGNIIFSVVKAFSNVNYDKETYKNFDKLTINGLGSAKYIYLDELANCGNCVLDIKLEDTYTKADLEIGQESLSTLASNNNVELKLKLNNETLQSDVYGNSVFDIKMPRYVTGLEITDASIVYVEGLELSNVSTFENNGELYLRVELSGIQNKLSSGIISNGTNIVLNANINVDLFAPAVEDNFELSYTNSEVTTYKEEINGIGFTKTPITYSAPSGVVSVNSILEYKEGSSITSVKQGKKTAELPVYSEAKIATMDLIVMNNEKNAVSEVTILGRVPNKEAKDIVTNELLGTTIDTKMMSRIRIDEQNNGEFIVYYSESADATKDLDDSNNGWTLEPENLNNVKSFLIVPKSNDYKMEVSSKLRFSYDFEIPANLEHSEEIYGIFGTYYTNATDIATLNETSIADIVGLVTSEGPRFDYNIKVNNASINEFEMLEIEVDVKNTGKMDAKDVIVEVPIPNGTKYQTATSSMQEAKIVNNEEKVQFNLETLKIGETATFNLSVEASDLYTEEEDIVETEVYALLTATDLDTTLKTEVVPVSIRQAQLRVIVDKANIVHPVLTKGKDVKLWIRVQNLKNEEIKNVKCTLELDEVFDYKKAFVVGYEEDGINIKNVKDATFDEATRVITWEIDNIASLDIATLELDLGIKLLDENTIVKSASVTATAECDEIGNVTSAPQEFVIGRPSLKITQTTPTTNTYVKEGEVVKYNFQVVNEGTVAARSVNFIDEIPTGLVVRKINYEVDGVPVEQAISEKDKVTIGATIPAGSTLNVDIEAVATSLNGVQERSVTNGAKVSAINVNEEESNYITHIVEASGKIVSSQGESSSGLASSSVDETLSSISKTYKITGTAWLDKNEDGKRDDTEELMKNIKATLVDSDNGIIKQTTITNSNGEYTFTGVNNGNYIIIFDYDTVRYTVTVYQKENVLSNVNSDVITTKIEQDGVLRNGAVTDVITVADGSISNIDIGLMDALKFDLSLDMGISKITVQNSKGTNTVEYKNSKLTKTEIASKQMAGTVVYIEYTFNVKNEGEISGFAKKIVDYIPEDMNFNSGMNGDWYTGTDGNLYTSSLSNVEIKPGETRTFKLVLSRTMTDENTGIISNTAEIAEDYNIYGVSDLDSTPLNKVQNEDDFARADSYLSVKTGEVFIYISVIITTIVLIGIAVFIIVLKFRYRLNKGGV